MVQSANFSRSGLWARLKSPHEPRHLETQRHRRRLIERDGRFLLVEEETDEGLRFNQPAGHLDEGESLVAACMREALEETAWHVRPTALVGVYQWPRPQRDITYLRFAFACEVGRRAGRRARSTPASSAPSG